MEYKRIKRYLKNPMELYYETIGRLKEVGYYSCYGEEAVYEVVGLDRSFLEQYNLLDILIEAKQVYLESLL